MFDLKLSICFYEYWLLLLMLLLCLILSLTQQKNTMDPLDNGNKLHLHRAPTQIVLHQPKNQFTQNILSIFLWIKIIEFNSIFDDWQQIRTILTSLHRILVRYGWSITDQFLKVFDENCKYQMIWMSLMNFNYTGWLWLELIKIACRVCRPRTSRSLLF